MAGLKLSALQMANTFGEEAQALVGIAGERFQQLWPGEDVPELISELAAWLEKADVAITRLQESAARGGAEWTLCLLRSWHPEIRLEDFTLSFRTGTSYKDLREDPEIRETACVIADFIDFDVFIPDRDVRKPSAGEDDEADASDEVQPGDELKDLTEATLALRQEVADAAWCSPPKAD